MVVRLRLLLLMALSSWAVGFMQHQPASSRIPSIRTSWALQMASNTNELIPLRRGSSVALVTPFEPDTGKIDFAGLRKLLQYHVDSQTDNLCILGTTGEASVMTMQEREQVLRTAVEEVKGKMSILAGTGTIDPAAVKSMTLQAADIGCDASLVVTPYYVKPPQRCLIKHFVTAADYGLPVVIYNVPGRTAVDMLDESILTAAAQHDNIVGLKDATGKVERVKHMLEKLPADANFLLYSGDDKTTTEFIQAGGDGCISVTANVAAADMHNVVHAALAGNDETVAQINEKLRGLHQSLFVESNPIPVKWAVHRIGLIDSPYCRPPLDEMDPIHKTAVEDALAKAGLL